MPYINETTPLIVIVGQTASGKSDLAIEIAKRFDGEIVSADSRNVYRYLDIGTAKPTPKQLSLIKHHIIDIADPDKQFTVADFQKIATLAIGDISNRGKLPILVGGSGLYINSIIYDYKFRPKGSSKYAKKLERLNVQQLQKIILSNGLKLPIDPKNPRRLIRTIITMGAKDNKSEIRKDTLVIGLKLDSAELILRIKKRVDKMIDQGFILELTKVSQNFGWYAPGLQTIGYQAFKSYLDGKMTLDEAKNEFVKNDLSLAKRQSTWFARNESIQWVKTREDAVDLVTTFLNKFV